MKVVVTSPFYDIKEQCSRKTKEVFEVDEQRFDKLTKLGLVKQYDESEVEAEKSARSSRKKTAK